jgi:hypothetical protein
MSLFVAGIAEGGFPLFQLKLNVGAMGRMTTIAIFFLGLMAVPSLELFQSLLMAKKAELLVLFRQEPFVWR